MDGADASATSPAKRQGASLMSDLVIIKGQVETVSLLVAPAIGAAPAMPAGPIISRPGVARTLDDAPELSAARLKGLTEYAAFADRLSMTNNHWQDAAPLARELKDL